MKDGHLTSQFTSVPTTSGSTWVATLTNATDVAGHISFVAGATAGTEIVTFAKAYNIAPIVILTPANAIAATHIALVSVTSTTTTFTIHFAAGGTAAGHAYNYYAIETQ